MWHRNSSWWDILHCFAFWKDIYLQAESVGWGVSRGGKVAVLCHLMYVWKLTEGEVLVGLQKRAQAQAGVLVIFLIVKVKSGKLNGSGGSMSLLDLVWSPCVFLYLSGSAQQIWGDFWRQSLAQAQVRWGCGKGSLGRYQPFHLPSHKSQPGLARAGFWLVDFPSFLHLLCSWLLALAWYNQELFI